MLCSSDYQQLCSPRSRYREPAHTVAHTTLHTHSRTSQHANLFGGSYNSQAASILQRLNDDLAKGR